MSCLISAWAQRFLFGALDACRTSPRGLLALVVLVAAANPSATRAVSSSVSLGFDLHEKPCAARMPHDLSTHAQEEQEFLLKCGGHQIGVLWQLPARGTRPSDGPAIIEQALALTALQATRDALSCAPKQTLMEGQVALAPCRLRSGGWPTIVAVGRTSQGLRFAYGPPIALPALMHWTSGQPARSTDPNIAFTLLERLFNGRVALASAADRARLDDLARDARVANSEGRDADAEAMLRELLSQQRKLLSEFDTATAQTLLELALSVANQGRVLEAEALMRAAEPILERAPSPAERARLDLYRGLVAAGAGAHDAAMRYATAAAAALRADEAGNTLAEVLAAAQSDPSQTTAERKPPGALIIALNLQAAMALRTGAIEVADAAASEALRLIDALPDAPPAWRPEILLTLGRVSSAKGRISAAETYLTTALAFQRMNIGDGQRSLAILAALGEAYEREAMYTSAILTFGELATLIDRWPALEPPRIPEEWLLPYARAVTARLAQIEHTDQRDQLLEEALELLQRASPERLAITAEQIARERERMDPDYATLRETLRTARRAYDLAQLSLAIEAARPDRARSRIEEDRLEAERRDAQTSFDSAQRTLALRHASVQKLVLPPAVSAKALRPNLAADEALIQYLVGDGGSFALVVRRDRVDLIALPAAHRSSLETDIAELRTGLAGDRSPGRPFDTALARRISDQIVSPLSAALEGVQRLQIVTGGALSALPLGLLPVAVQSTDSVSAQKWLIERYIISHTPSVAVFQSQRSISDRRDGRPRPALAIGISRWSASSQRPAITPIAADGPGSGLDRLNERCLDGKPLDPSLLAALPPLPGIETELNALSRTLSHRGRSLTLRMDDEATEQSFRSEPLSEYALLYFATHAVLPGAARCLNEPAIALSAFGPGASRSNDGLLEASEVASLRLDADLVVLSACNTATGAQGHSGESLTGLAQAFFSAGARRVLASHWAIDSQRTADLMASAFSFQRAGDYDDIAESLREAQIKMLHNPATAHPWFWGGFTVLGTGPKAAAR